MRQVSLHLNLFDHRGEGKFAIGTVDRTECGYKKRRILGKTPIPPTVAPETTTEICL